MREWRGLAWMIALGLGLMVGVAQAGGVIRAVGVENQYADVIGQIGGRYVRVDALMNNPNTDPHTIEVNPKMALVIARAGLIVENGLGYDGWAAKMIAATPKAGRVVIEAGRLVRVPGDTENPHIWYDPRAMTAVARAIGAALTRLAPSHAAYFAARVQKFDHALGPWRAAIAAFKARDAGVAVAVTEPVGDDLLAAMGAKIMTPMALQAAIMNGTDPAPQDVATENALLRAHRVKVLVYNRQVTDPLTASFLRLAAQNHIPVVGVYETMPTPGYDYQSWMLAETKAVQRAVSAQQSTRSLLPRRAP
ncbi:MAG TPA: zinc ABC transporter substrate-binding protein [Acidiphilium sp.]|nr:MAG: cation ABC transporter substrate-binding protein [Acidiphilium sp. 21-60-14]OYV90733.1 MAG: cation ABC transporter substrate-binding protein [Acidiphilium sp. 37-60-79]OZB40046.1 MAG: cation ABC transporter substrate-binding protein [Acidiphilium sp. 34-60-192]HQT89007.1 zinc ABC transporter substrate-binding protein [Acidiphilium sp.]HQU24104.1 zinc ABC transporter substrate-binding protein [Acidiphilium sp.]